MDLVTQAEELCEIRELLSRAKIPRYGDSECFLDLMKNECISKMLKIASELVQTDRRPDNESSAGKDRRVFDHPHPVAL